MSAIAEHLTDAEVLRVLGERLKAKRLGRNITIDFLSERTGMNRKTIMDVESGKDSRLSSVVRYLRGMSMLSTLEAAFPDELPSGDGLSSRGQPRLKASSIRRRRG